MEEVFPGIFLIKQKGSFGQIKPPENIYVLAGHDGIIYDAGYGNRKTVRIFIKELNEIKKFYEENKHRLVIIQLPPYSPNLNPIEQVWKAIKKWLDF